MPFKPVAVSKNVVIIRSTNHPSAFRKIRCPKCQSYATGDPSKMGQYNCPSCGSVFRAQSL